MEAIDEAPEDWNEEWHYDTYGSITMDKTDFRSAVERLRLQGYDMYPDRVRIQIPNAKELLQHGLQSEPLEHKC